MLQLEIGVFLYMSLLLYTTESCTSEDNISGIQFDNQSTTVHIYQHQTVYHFEEQSDFSGKVLFSTYGHISVSDGISTSSLSNAELIAGGDVKNGGYREGFGDHARFRGITDFCQNGKHIIVVDKMNHCIRSINYDNGKGNNLTTPLAGKCGKYNKGYLDSDASSALFDKPHSILITKIGNTLLYLVTDTGNNAIRVIDTDKGEVTTFERASRHLIEPIDLIFSQNRSSLYVTTLSGLTMIDLQSPQTRQISPITGSSNFGSLYKMTWFANDAYLISDYGDNKLIVLNTTNNKFWCEGKGNNHHLDGPRGVFFSRRNCAIIVGAYQHVQRLNVSGKICNNANPVLEVPGQNLTTSFTTSTTTSTTISTTTRNTTSSKSSTTTTTTSVKTTSSTTSSTISSAISSESTTRENSTETSTKPGLAKHEIHIFVIYGLVGFSTILLLVIAAIRCRQALRRYTHKRGTRRQLPPRPGALSSITTISTHYDQIHLRNSGLSSESGTHTNHLHSMSNGPPPPPLPPPPQEPMSTNRRNTDGYTPMHVNPESVYTRMNNAVYQNIQPEGIRLLPTEPVTSETEMYTDDVYSQRQ